MASPRLAALATSIAGTLLLAGCPSPPSPAPPVDTGSADPVTAAAPPGDESPPEPPRSEGDGKTLFVDAELVDCEGEGPMKCMRIRESESAEWELLYSGIEGFDHQPGVRYELKVRVENDGDPPADGSSRRLILVKIVSEKKSDEEAP